MLEFDDSWLFVQQKANNPRNVAIGLILNAALAMTIQPCPSSSKEAF